MNGIGNNNGGNNNNNNNNNSGGCYCIILTGYPCSGKTTVAYEIKRRAISIDPTIQVLIINDNSIASASLSSIHPSSSVPPPSSLSSTDDDDNSKNNSIASCYQTNESEKKLRGELKSSFDRIISSSSSSSSSSLNKKTIIILDALNYIKGYRYELFCIAKATKCIYCIVWCLTDHQMVHEWNDNSSLRYSKELLDELILRYEPPDERNRWDKPLYKIQTVDVKNNTMITNQTTSTTTTSGIVVEDKLQHETMMTQQPKVSLDQQILSQSIYNMHNLSDALQQQQKSSNNNANMNNKLEAGVTTTTTRSVNDSTTKKITASSTFKRAPKKNKKPIITNQQTTTLSNEADTVPSTTSSLNNIHHQPFVLTAEALERHEYLLQPPVVVDAAIPLTNDDDNEKHHDNSLLNNNNNEMIEATADSNTTTDNNMMIQLSLQEQIDEMLQSFLYNVKPLNEGISTRQHISSNSDVLHLVDYITQQVCSSIIKAQTQELEVIQQQQQQDDNKNLLETLHSDSQSSLTLSITIDDDHNNNNINKVIKVDFHRLLLEGEYTTPKYMIYNLTELNQLRAQYIQWSIKHPPGDSTPKNIAKLFIQYIEARQQTTVTT